MIKINVLKKNDLYKEINLDGHAEYANYGKDIVCSGVSSILVTTVNGINLINSNGVVVNQFQNKISLEKISEDEITQKLIHNMVNLFLDLKRQYPKNIKIEEEDETCIS